MNECARVCARVCVRVMCDTSSLPCRVFPAHLPGCSVYFTPLKFFVLPFRVGVLRSTSAEEEGLRSMGERLSAGDEAEWHREQQQVAENAESELKLNAEAMFSAAVHGPAPLPSLATNGFRADPYSATPPQQLPALQLPAPRTRSAGDPTRPGVATARAVNNPAGVGSREYLAKRLGIQAPASSGAPRQVGQRPTKGKLDKAKVAITKGAIERNLRRDPHATRRSDPKTWRRACSAW